MKKNKFQKQFIPKEKLLEIYPLIQEPILKLRSDYENKLISDSEFCASYILTFYKILYPKKWKMGLSPIATPSTYPDLKTICDYNIRCLPYNVRMSLAEWSQESYPMRLLFEIPTSLEILELQAKGLRCVTALTDDRLKYYVMNERDPLSFLIHDLLHAHHFWSDAKNAKAQVVIYNWFLALNNQKLLVEPLTDSAFKQGFEYISSDMNTHPLHLLKTFKFHIDDYFLRNNLSSHAKEHFLDEILNVHAQDEKKGKFISEFSFLNTSRETPEVINKIGLFLL